LEQADTEITTKDAAAGIDSTAKLGLRPHKGSIR
jgi:hypothetical protein